MSPPCGEQQHELHDYTSVRLRPELYLRNRISQNDAKHFLEHGYLIVPNALSSTECAELTSVLEEMRSAKIAEGRESDEGIVQAAFSPSNNISEHDCTLKLLTNEVVFPKVVDILGCNIRVYHAHFNHTPGSNNPESAPVDYDAHPTFQFHQDSHRVNVEMGHNHADRPRPRLSLKCCYYLSDCSTPGAGNTWIVPGTCSQDELPPLLGGVGQPHGAIPVLAPAGSCLIFDRRLWHCATPNWSTRSRLACFVGYAPKWMKPRDAMFVEPALQQPYAQGCAVCRQLLGVSTSMAGNYGGNMFDMPLRHWLHKIGVNSGLGLELRIRDDWGNRGLGSEASGGLDGDRAHASHPRVPERALLPVGQRVGSYNFPSLHKGGGAAGLALDCPDGVDLDPTRYLEGRLTDDERAFFEANGFLLVKNALPPDQYAEIMEAVDKCRADAIGTGQNTRTEMTHAAAFSPANDLQQVQAIRRLLTNEVILAKAVDILGFNIYCYHYHVNITPASATGAAEDLPTADEISAKVKTFRYHQDSGQSEDMEEQRDDVEPFRFSIKCAYFLTDTLKSGMANTWIVPTQHKRGKLELPASGVGQPKLAAPALCPANSCLIFDRRLWHSPTPNWSNATRKVCFVGYSFRWCQPKDGMFVEPAMQAASCPILRQMLGYTTSNAGLYQPNCADTPLRPWLHSLGIDEPLGPSQERPHFGPNDGLLPVPMTVRELEAQGLFEGDAGHRTDPRVGDVPRIHSQYRRQGAAGSDGQSMKERLDAEERSSLFSARL